jgi:hypothetical protein
VWSTDSNGNYVSNVIGAVAGNSSALEALETTFGQDLNGDGHIGIPSVVLQTDGTTALTEVGNNFFLDNTGSGSGPELQFGGAAVTPILLGTWTPIGAVQVSGGGYDVALHNNSSGLYTVWSTDSNGNYVSNVIGAVAGNSSALEALEPTFNQDLNGDGHIGIYAASGTTLQVTSPLPSTTLADLFTPLLSADLSSAVRASLRSWLNDEIDDGLAYGRQAWLRRWTVDSFFSAPLVRDGDAGGMRKRSWS